MANLQKIYPLTPVENTQDQVAGIEVTRSSGDNATLIWDDNQNEWLIGTDGNEAPILSGVPGNNKEIIFNDNGSLGTTPNAINEGEAGAFTFGLNRQGGIGFTSFVIGNGNEGSGINSFSSGFDNVSSGDHSVTFGQKNVALGQNSVAGGNQSTVSGSNAMGVGDRVSATGDDTLAVGNLTTASSLTAAAFGNATTASGPQSFAMGNGSEATAQLSFAGGEDSFATSLGAIGIGSTVISEANWAVAFGTGTRSSAPSGLVVGDNLTNKVYGATVVGVYNDDYLGFGNEVTSIGALTSSDRMFVVGNGTGSFGEDNDAFYVTYGDGIYADTTATITAQSGQTDPLLQLNDDTSSGVFNIDQQGVISTTLNQIASPINIADFVLRDAITGNYVQMPGDARHFGNYSFGFGELFSNSFGGTHSFMSGRNHVIDSDYCASFGNQNSIDTNSDKTYVFGENNVVNSSVFTSFISGDDNTTNTSSANIIGNNNVVSDVSTHYTVIGLNNSVTRADASAIIGTGNTVDGSSRPSGEISAFIIGSSCINTGYDSVAMSNNTIARGNFETVVGIFNKDWLGEGNEVGSSNDNQSSLNTFDSLFFNKNNHIFSVGIGDDPDNVPGEGGYFDGLGREDGFYVTYRNGTYVRNGLTVERFLKNDSTGEYITNSSTGEVEIEEAFAVAEDGTIRTNGTAGATGSFTVQSGETVTVENGIITDIT